MLSLLHFKKRGHFDVELKVILGGKGEKGGPTIKKGISFMDNRGQKLKWTKVKKYSRKTYKKRGMFQ